MQLGLFLCSTFALFVYVQSHCPNIISKKNWGGTPSTDIQYIVTPMKYAIIEHTVSNECFDQDSCTDIVYNIQRYHVDTNGWEDIGYNFLIGGDGNVYEGVGWHKVGSHAIGWNKKSLGIAFIGDFSRKLPPQAALDAAKQLLQCGVETQELEDRYKLLGHRQILSTASPGTRLYREIVTWPNWSSEP